MRKPRRSGHPFARAEDHRSWTEVREVARAVVTAWWRPYWWPWCPESIWVSLSKWCNSVRPTSSVIDINYVVGFEIGKDSRCLFIFFKKRPMNLTLLFTKVPFEVILDLKWTACDCGRKLPGASIGFTSHLNKRHWVVYKHSPRQPGLMIWDDITKATG